MVRLHLVVEGQTEEAFVKSVLAPFLWDHAVIADARRIETGKRRGYTYRGGFTRYERLRKDLMLWMKQDQNPDAYFTTMVDLYRLPQDFPGIADEEQRDPIRRVTGLECSLASDIGHVRFIPYIQLHEFEALLFAKPEKFELVFPEKPQQIRRLERLRSGFATPEHIDDGEETAPSKRIKSVFPEYEKVAAGHIIAQAIGIQVLLKRCSHFAAWVTKLKTLGQ